MDLLSRYQEKRPEVVFQWKDPESEAEGCLVVNSLRGGAAGGGTRMRKGLDQAEVESLAKTMEVKFTVSGPGIGGAKSGINFDPSDPRKAGVLKRWYRAVRPFLKEYYGTGGDLNVDQAQEVIPFTRDLGILHPQEGIVRGHYGANGAHVEKRIANLQKGVVLPVLDPHLSPDPARGLTVADLITGWGVAEAVRHFYTVFGGSQEGKRVIVQGWGNVGAAAGFYLSQMGASVVAIMDIHGGLICREGFGAEEVRSFILDQSWKKPESGKLLPPEALEAEVWDLGAEIFVPCAASRLITDHQIQHMVQSGVQLISPGANVPFADPEVYLGATGRAADESVSLIPDFVANCGMARVFAYLMAEEEVDISEHAIFEDTSRVISEGLTAIHDRNPGLNGLTRTGLEIALQQLL